MKTARVLQSRRLRDGRQLVEVTCPHCAGTHWMMTTDGSTLAHCVAQPSLVFFLDRRVQAVR
jgi:hypothetical protein